MTGFSLGRNAALQPIPATAGVGEGWPARGGNNAPTGRNRVKTTGSGQASAAAIADARATAGLSR